MNNYEKAAKAKDQSIKNSSILRDSALFTASRLGTFKQATQEDFIEEWKFWRKFFEKQYNEKERSEAHLASQKEYKKDPLNSIDFTLEEAGQHLAE